jgi:3-oxoadipate enol-lactonase
MPVALLDHDDTGVGQTVCLLHSGVTDRRMWAGLRSALPNGLRVIAADLRGFGGTPMPAPDFSYTDAEDVASLLDAAGISAATVVGSSLGGRVALELATTRPDLVSSLVLLCAGYRGVDPTGTELAFGAEEDRLLDAGDIDGAVALNVDAWLGPDASGAAREFVRVMQRRALDLQLTEPEHPGPDQIEVDPSTIDVPALVVIGEQDFDHFIAVGEHLAAAMPQARLVRLPWAGHLPALERPAETVALVTSWLYDMGSI